MGLRLTLTVESVLFALLLSVSFTTSAFTDDAVIYQSS